MYTHGLGKYIVSYLQPFCFQIKTKTGVSFQLEMVCFYHHFLSYPNLYISLSMWLWVWDLTIEALSTSFHGLIKMGSCCVVYSGELLSLVILLSQHPDTDLFASCSQHLSRCFCLLCPYHPYPVELRTSLGKQAVCHKVTALTASISFSAKKSLMTLYPTGPSSHIKCLVSHL